LGEVSYGAVVSALSTMQQFELLAKRDPLWAILTDPSRKGNRWRLDEFLATGESEIDHCLRFLARRGLSPIDSAVALDFGCGVGRLTRALARRFDRVYGVDAAPTMIENIERAAADARCDISQRIESRLGRLVCHRFVLRKRAGQAPIASRSSWP
jgi:2-polyprenyl-3-methyl-5-hydroxy-6-metoxy-1,4-benzoquinol methylase